VERQNLLVRKLTHRRDSLEEIFLKAMGHLTHTPGEGPPSPRSGFGEAG
jgi:hypothetical protein